MVVAQDSTYTQTISNTVSIDPVNNELYVNLYSDTYNNESTYNTVLGTGTVTVTVTDIYGEAVPDATVYWRGVQYPASAYTNRETTTTDSNGRSTLTLSNAALTLTTSFAFQIDAVKSNYVSALSNDTYQDYTVYVNETDSAYTNISRSYAQSNAIRTGQGDFLYFGYYDTSWDNQRSAMGFTTGIDWGKIDASAEVVSATLRITRGNAAGTNPGTMYIGTHENRSGSSANWTTYGSSAFGSINARQQSISQSDGTTVTIALNSTIRNLLYDGGVGGFTLGPPTSTSLTYYSKVYGQPASSSVRPLFTVTYNVIPTWNVP
jgi:hypothetical protein